MRAVLLLILLTGTAAADGVTIPLIGQPPVFYGLAGHGVTAEATVEPTTLTRDQSCTLTLRLANLLNAADVRRPVLEDLDAAFREDFQVEAMPDGPAGKGERVCRYRLRPRRVGTLEIPVIAIAYYDPRRKDSPAAFSGHARTEDPITITVTKPAGPPPMPPTPLDIPAFAETLEEVSSPRATPRNLFCVLGLLLLPLAALGFFVWWRNPGDDVQQRRRRSQVARRTLHRLRRTDLTLDELTAVMRTYFETCRAPTADRDWAGFTVKTDELRYAPAASLTINDLRVATRQAVEGWEADR